VQPKQVLDLHSRQNYQVNNIYVPTFVTTLLFLPSHPREKGPQSQQPLSTPFILFVLYYPAPYVLITFFSHHYSQLSPSKSISQFRKLF